MNWTQQTLPVSTQWYWITWNGGVFFATSYTGATAATSPDGVSWTQQTLPATLGITGAAWGNGVFAVVSTPGSLGMSVAFVKSLPI